MALYHKWDVKNAFTYVLTFFSLISDGLGGVPGLHFQKTKNKNLRCFDFEASFKLLCTFLKISDLYVMNQYRVLSCTLHAVMCVVAILLKHVHTSMYL